MLSKNVIKDIQTLRHKKFREETRLFVAEGPKIVGELLNIVPHQFKRVYGLKEWIDEHKEIEGTYNCSSPNPVTNEEFMRILRKVTGTQIGLPAYKWMLQMGAPLIGTEVELVLKSRWVVPTKILETGFQFRYSLLEDALLNIISKVPRRQYHLF